MTAYDKSNRGRATLNLFVWSVVVLSWSGCHENEPQRTDTFTSDGVSLTASTVSGENTQKTTVTRDGDTQLTMTLDPKGIRLAFADVDETTDIAFSTPLARLPSHYSTNILATYIAGTTQNTRAASHLQELDLKHQLDSPGCNFIKDTQCMLGCCADHDLCYDTYGCSASSFISPFSSSACNNCNVLVVDCIMAACSGVIQPRTNDRCYDARCGAHFDCGEGGCGCAKPCDGISPDSCGNGSCEVNETRENCPNDCKNGDARNQCCVETNNCPSELPKECPGECCCCGQGLVCNRITYLCSSLR